MRTALTLLVSSCILIQGAIAAPLHNKPGFANAVAQTTYKDRSCREQAGSCVIQPQYQALPQATEYSYVQPQMMTVYQQNEQQPADQEPTPDEGQMEQAPAEDTQGAEQPTDDESTPDQGQMEQAPVEDDQSQSEDPTQSTPSYTTTPSSWNIDLSQLQPKQALLDEVKVG
ncbi:hypothetical protein K7432_016543 [Basidiobolus ranarum]|uniref:Uncharacterized protein n=1 Tax=Basidiobolus ranarum TaxID=34480 RepID=A0ABR2WEL0_9FUNG